MSAGVVRSRDDARWLATARGHEGGMCLAAVDTLTAVGLWYAYEVARCPSMGYDDIRVDRDGWLLIPLNDDVNPPGWYHYRPRAENDDAARQLVLERFGAVVEVPLAAMLSERPVGGK